MAPSGPSRGPPFGSSELIKFRQQMQSLEQGEIPFDEGVNLLLEIACRPPPPVALLKASRAGVSVRRLRNHPYFTISELATVVMAKWREGADAEVRWWRRRSM